MPELAAFSRLAPFTIDELVDAANSVLRERPRLQVSKRTVRYYVSETILPPPTGSPKYARYGMDHLLRLVGARCLLDRGSSLEEVRAEFARSLRGTSEDIETVQSLINGDGILAEQEDSFAGSLESPPAPRMPPHATVRRLFLGDGYAAEAPAGVPIGLAVEELIQRLSAMATPTDA